MPAICVVRGSTVPPFGGCITGINAALLAAGVLASGGEDRRICVWDLSRSDGAGEGANKPLIFMHSGHRGGVCALGGPCMPPKDSLTVDEWLMSLSALKQACVLRASQGSDTSRMGASCSLMQSSH